jgi:hypothetical protein
MMSNNNQIKELSSLSNYGDSSLGGPVNNGMGYDLLGNYIDPTQKPSSYNPFQNQQDAQNRNNNQQQQQYTYNPSMSNYQNPNTQYNNQNQNYQYNHQNTNQNNNQHSYQFDNKQQSNDNIQQLNQTKNNNNYGTAAKKRFSELMKNDKQTLPKLENFNMSNIKNTVNDKFGINLNLIHNLSPTEIDKLIYKLKNDIYEKAGDIVNNHFSNINDNEKEKFNNIMNKVVDIEEPKKNKSKTKHKSKSKKHKYSDSDDSSDEEVVMKEKKNVRFKSDLIVKSNEYTDETDYNDYLVQLSPSYKNVTKIELFDYDFPKELNYINSKNNIIKFVVDNIEIELEAPPNSYSIDEIIELINSEINKKGINMMMDEEEHIIICSKDESEDCIFTVDTSSLGRLLGFTNIKIFTFSFKREFKYSKSIFHSPSLLYINL